LICSLNRVKVMILVSNITFIRLKESTESLFNFCNYLCSLSFKIIDRVFCFSFYGFELVKIELASFKGARIVAYAFFTAPIEF
jgi:hypothetical protein